MLNVVVLTGRSTRDSEMRYSSAGNPITSFTLAVDRRQKDKGPNFIDIVCFGKLAEVAANGVQKGKLYGIQGELDISPYEDIDGNKRKSIKIIANNVQFLSPKGQERPQEAEDEYEGESIPF
jgi:single-strand DNA-binding protein